MQDWENSGSNNGSEESTDSFSWKDAKDEAMKNYSDYAPKTSYKYEPMPSQGRSRQRSDSIFHSAETSGVRRRGNYNPSGFGSVRYDYPGDDYSYEKYSPKSAYDDSIFMNTSGESVRASAQKRAEPQRKMQSSDKRQQGTKKTDTSKAKKKKKTKNKNVKTASANKSAGNAAAKQRSSQNKGRPVQQKKKSSRPIDKKQTQKMRERELKAEASRRKKVQRSNEDYINRTTKGESEDDIRKKRSKKTRRNGKFYAVISVAVLIVCAVSALLIYCYAHGAPIETINVEGLSSYKQEEVLKAGEIVKGENMFRIRKGKTAKTISKLLPYIKTVEIDFDLPSTLNLKITETDEKYLISNGTNYICVDESGKVVSDKKKKVKSGKYRLDGFTEQQYEVGENFVPNEKNEEKYETAKQLISAIEKVGLKNCTVINLNKLDEICITCDSKIKIYVESGTDFERRLKLAQMTIDSKIKSGSKYYIDLRYSDRAILKDGELT
ncbi:MAG: FtsQ-type POTRA domain-containing protein [Faecalibacterium sp.]|nr:FtsQ-type POTRA domain-containing protein [Ruminococcus sp.]MCM1485414.1 FtsQ-type POTRA domain-containing protein [Faecalibacterium sp.]